jgi:hypothetical protein
LRLIIGSGIGSSNIRSLQVLGHIRSGRVLGHLVSGHFRFRVVSGRVGSGIGSFSVGLFQILGRIGSGRVSWVGPGSATSSRDIKIHPKAKLFFYLVKHRNAYIQLCYGASRNIITKYALDSNL